MARPNEAMWGHLENALQKLFHLPETVAQIKVLDCEVNLHPLQAKLLSFTVMLQRLSFPEKKTKIRYVCTVATAHSHKGERGLRAEKC